MAISDRMKRMHNCVGVSFNEAEGFNGQVYTCYFKEPVSFADVHEFFSIVNEFMDELDFPAQKTKFRSFKKTLPIQKPLNIDTANKLCDTEHLLEHLGSNSYVIMMLGRDNATWQGNIYSKDLDKEFSFNSEVELFRIINK